MSNPHKIALIGFSSFERATFESFFRLAARRPPGYVLVTNPAEANLAIRLKFNNRRSWYLHFTGEKPETIIGSIPGIVAGRPFGTRFVAKGETL